MAGTDHHVLDLFSRRISGTGSGARSAAHGILRDGRKDCVSPHPKLLSVAGIHIGLRWRGLPFPTEPALPGDVPVSRPDHDDLGIRAPDLAASRDLRHLV